MYYYYVRATVNLVDEKGMCSVPFCNEISVDRKVVSYDDICKIADSLAEDFSANYNKDEKEVDYVIIDYLLLLREE